MDHYITIVANDKLGSFPLMTSDLRGQGHSGLPLQPLQSLEKFLLLLTMENFNFGIGKKSVSPRKYVISESGTSENLCTCAARDIQWTRLISAASDKPNLGLLSG